MISLLVSSKTMAPHDAPFAVSKTQPQFIDNATILHGVLLKKTAKQLEKLMHISPKLSQEVHQNISRWSPEGGTPAWYTFVGDVYKGLKIHELSADDLHFAEEHMATLSGLYGLVRPFDVVQPYRLELMYRLSGKGFRNLYEFWGSSIANTIPAGEPVVNLSSEEYIKLLRPFLPKDQIITPWFMQLKAGAPDFQAVHAKIARGTMARWIAKNRINDPLELKDFDYNGYKYRSELSTTQKPVFTRAEGYDFRSDY